GIRSGSVLGLLYKCVLSDESVTMGRTLLFASSSNIFDSVSKIYKDHYDDIMKNIFNSGRHINKVGMKIPDWMITDEMKKTEHYRMTTSAPRSPNPVKEVAKLSALRRSTVIHLRLPERRSTVSLAEHKSREEQEARENVALVAEHLAFKEVEKMVDDSSIPRNDESNIPGTRIEPRSDKGSPEVEIVKEKEVEISQETKEEITNIIIPVNVTDEDEEITNEVYELKRMEKGKNVEEFRNSPILTLIRSPRILSNLVSSDTEKLQELTDTPHATSSSGLPHKKLTKTNRLLSLFKTKPTRFKRYKSFFHELQGRYGYLFAHLRVRFMPRKSFDTLADNLHDVMVESLPEIVDKHVKKQVMQQVPEQVRNQVPVYVAEGLILERKKAKEETERLIAKAILQERGNIQAQILTQIENAIANVIPSQVDASVRNYMSGHILHVHPAQSQTSSVPEQQYQLYLAMKADPQLQQQDIAIWLALQMKFERHTVLQTACRTPAVRPRDQDDPHDDAHPEGENSAKRQKTSEYEAYVSGESSSGQVFQEEQAPSTSGNQEQDDDFDFWTDSYATDDDEIPTKQVSQDIMEEVSLTIDEAKLRKMADEMLRQRCTSGDEHQYHIDQMKNFLKSDIVWESRKEILVSPHPRKTTPLVHSCQKDPEAPALSLINQDLLYLKKGNSRPEKIVLSLHKFPAIIFNDDDIEERTSRWVNKCVKKFNPYARYGVEHWKNPHAKIFYIRKQKEPGKPKEEIYSNSKIVQVIKTYWELGHEHKFITEIVARRANDCIVSITEPDYKNLNKNDIEDIYLLIMNGKVPDYADTRLLWSLSVFIRSSVIWERVHDFQLGIESYQQKVNLTTPTMTFPGIEDHEMFSIIYEHVHGIIYKNSKKEKRVMRHSEIYKFCEELWEMYVNGRPLDQEENALNNRPLGGDCWERANSLEFIINAEEKCGAHYRKTDALLVFNDFIEFDAVAASPKAATATEKAVAAAEKLMSPPGKVVAADEKLVLKEHEWVVEEGGIGGGAVEEEGGGGGGAMEEEGGGGGGAVEEEGGGGGGVVSNKRPPTVRHDGPTQGILDAGGIFLYNTPNEAFKILEDKVLFQHDFSGRSQNSPKPKTVVSAGGNNINPDLAILVDKFKALATKIDSEFLIIRKELKEMQDGRRDNHALDDYLKDDTPMCEPNEANYVQRYHGGYHDHEPINSYSYPNHNSHPSRYFEYTETSTEEMMREWMASQTKANERMKNQVVELENQINQGLRNHQEIIQNLERQFEFLLPTKTFPPTTNMKPRHEIV
ncbi:hypothetical protein Tco_0976797, partial [Tanacetum coccineum]